MITTILFLLLALGSTETAPAQYPRTMYVGYQHAPVYESADYLSTILAELDRGDSVRVLGSDRKFFRIEHAGSTGYVLGSNLTSIAPKRKPARKPENAAQRKSDTSAVREKSPPERLRKSGAKADSTHRGSAASIRCSATTRAGSRCTRMVDDSSGICWQHRKK